MLPDSAIFGWIDLFLIPIAPTRAANWAVVIGEEAAATDRTLLDAVGAADLAFVLDPLDGTKNFASGLPLFGVMVAGTVRGEVALGAKRRVTEGAQGRPRRSSC